MASSYFHDVDFPVFECAADVDHEPCSQCDTELFFHIRDMFADVKCECDPPRLLCSEHYDAEACPTCCPLEEPESSSSEEVSSSSEEDAVYRKKYRKLKKRMRSMKKRIREEQNEEFDNGEYSA